MESTKECQSKSIKPINKDSVHRICSGQVVLNLAVAVKELVENALDAGATAVEIRLKNYGIDSIEVSDNGCGVIEENFQALTLKHHTSKLTDYSDLMEVTSFGFRGEALSSLCAVSDLVIITRHQNHEHATKIEYNHNGLIISKTPCSRQIGTTVCVSNLFSSLPVRQKEFHKNAKREFTKMTQLLYAYCLICVGAKITCTNQTLTNVKSTVVSTQGTSYKDNIAAIFGTKQLQMLLEVKPDYENNFKENIFNALSQDTIKNDESIEVEDVEIDLSEDSNDVEEVASSQCSKSQGYVNIKEPPFNFEGYISSCAHGSGRSSIDRQFYYVNSRPCEPNKVTKLVNETYRQFNSNQYPFVFLNVKLNRSEVDINLTPDKRKVFLTKEKHVLDVLKRTLIRLYETIPREMKIENSISQNSQRTQPNLDQPRVFNAFLKTFASKSGKEDHFDSKNVSLKNTDLKRKSSTILDFMATKNIKVSSHVDSLLDKKFLDDESKIIAENTLSDVNKPPKNSKNDNETYFKEIDNMSEICDASTIRKINASKEVDSFYDNVKNILNASNEDKEIMYLEYTDKLPNTQIKTVQEVIEENKHTIYCRTPKSAKANLKDSGNFTKTATKTFKLLTDHETIGKNVRKIVILKTSIEHVTALMELDKESKTLKNIDRVKFKSEINPVFNKICEDELKRELSTESFAKMEVIGQFNLGFIITKLNDDLFIIDQHATDEIYNFENLQKNTELSSQKLVIPQQLELTGVNEQILMDNIGVFKKNGFTFDIDEAALPTKRVKLLTIPMSKNWIFGKDDIEELLFMLRESPSEFCRPSRMRAMFASRACRKSVMIGTALNNADMKKLVYHMSEIDQPWNCPHGRPTIRHLVNLAMVKTQY